MIELPQNVIDAIDRISTQDEYDDKLAVYKASDPTPMRDEAIRILKASKSYFDTSDKFPSADLSKDMKDGQSDTSDIGGMN